jgi:glycosyltransferase involved in cell wall biosynthesis
MQPLVSIIIPTFNRGDFLLKAINSVLNQTYQNFELIIVDDGSTDHTFEVTRSFVIQEKIKYIRQENAGVSKARNKGAEVANGFYISFLDSDDEWLPLKLEKQIEYFKSNPKIEIAFTDEIWIRNNKRVNQKIIHKKTGGRIFKQCIQQCFIAPSSVIMTRDLFCLMGKFDETFTVCEDYDLWLKISSLYEIGLIDEALIIKNGGHDDQLSRKYFAMDLWRLKSLQNILNTRKLSIEDESAVKISIEQRGQILLIGYQKHGNMEKFEMVNKILEGIKVPKS